MAKKIVLAGACRTAIGTMGGELSTIPAPELGAIVIKEALKRAGVAPEAVDQVYMGCVIQAGQGQNVARQATLKAEGKIMQPCVAPFHDNFHASLFVFDQLLIAGTKQYER